jgi:hypothetical protein
MGFVANDNRIVANQIFFRRKSFVNGKRAAERPQPYLLAPTLLSFELAKAQLAVPPGSAYTDSAT